MGSLPDASTLLKYAASTVLLSLTAAGGLLYHFQNSIIYPSSLPEGTALRTPAKAQLIRRTQALVSTFLRQQSMAYRTRTSPYSPLTRSRSRRTSSFSNPILPVDRQ